MLVCMFVCRAQWARRYVKCKVSKRLVTILLLHASVRARKSSNVKNVTDLMSLRHVLVTSMRTAWHKVVNPCPVYV